MVTQGHAVVRVTDVGSATEIGKIGVSLSAIEEEDGAASLSIGSEDGHRFVYRLAPRSRPAPVFTAMDAPEGRRTLQWWLAAQTDGAGKPRDLTGFTQDQIASDLLEQLERWRLR